MSNNCWNTAFMILQKQLNPSFPFAEYKDKISGKGKFGISRYKNETYHLQAIKCGNLIFTDSQFNFFKKVGLH